MSRNYSNLANLNGQNLDFHILLSFFSSQPSTFSARSDMVETAINCEEISQKWSFSLFEAKIHIFYIKHLLTIQCATMLSAIFIEHLTAHAMMQ